MAFVLLFATACANEGLEVAAQETEGYAQDREQDAVQDVEQERGYDEVDEVDETNYRERLLQMGWDEEWLDMILEGGDISLQNMYNQTRFGEAAHLIMMGYSAVPSGEVVALQYMGPIRFDDNGVLNVAVLAGAFDDPASATAIDEMREMGMIVYEVRFSQQEITNMIDILNIFWDTTRAYGASSWGQGAENGVSIWMDPYSPEQIAIFKQHMENNGLDTDIMIFLPAVTDEMREFRSNAVAEAVTQTADLVVLVGDIDISRTSIGFSLENRTNYEFTYGSMWDLAYYHEGQWLPVPHLPGAGGGAWTMEAHMLQSGGIQQYRINFEWHFGDIPVGRYMFIRQGWTGDWEQDRPGTYVLVEFEITDHTPEALPPAEEQEWHPQMNIASHSNVTPTGMRVVVENVSIYDIDHQAQLVFIVPAERATSPYSWEWWNYQLPMLPIQGEWEDYFIQGRGFLPAGGTLEFEINWEAIFGVLPPDDYKIDLSLGGRAHPPHPSGWSWGSGVVEFTVE
jgi:hypothetical protein